MAEWKTNAQPDAPDSRDWIYQPSLRNLAPALAAPADLNILNQHSEAACTGFALAAAINLLNQRIECDVQVSARMLYEMAKRHDEWSGEDYEGSSLRGAIQGWRNMGVCSDALWPYRSSRRQRGDLTVERAKNARSNTLGAYYRLRPRITDYHAALNETGVIVASAKVHKGWMRPTGGAIEFNEQPTGGHAFAIVGYDEHGFLVQNSWSTSWGENGLARWSYEDWIRNVMDGWVFHLALPTPQIFGMRPESSRLLEATDEKRAQRVESSVTRDAIAGHFVHIDDGQFAAQDRYWSTAFDIEQTAELVSKSAKYKHLLIYAHGGLNSPAASATRIAAMKEVFKDNGIYPFHIMYDTGLVEELRDLIFNKGNKAQERVSGASDWLDRMVEQLVRRPGKLLWDEMKKDAQDAFDRRGAGTETLKLFIKYLRAAPANRRKKIHLAAHSTGAILFAHLVRELDNFDWTIESCNLMAPACSVDLYGKTYLPVLQGKKRLKLRKMQIFNLRDGLEQDDKVGSSVAYRKSLLYLVSNAFEQERERPLLGMEKFKGQVASFRNNPEFHYSNGVSGAVTRAVEHGDFDNDPHTMNHVLRTILRRKPKRPFRKEDMDH